MSKAPKHNGFTASKSTGQKIVSNITMLALEGDTKKVKSMIERNEYNPNLLAADLLRWNKLLSEKPSQSAKKLLEETYKLHSLIKKDGALDILAIDKARSGGALLNGLLLQDYIDKLVSKKSAEKLSDEQIYEINKIVSYFTKNDANINFPLEKSAKGSKTCITKTIDSIITNDASGLEVIDAKATHFAIALLKNGSGFLLSDEQKSKFAKAVLLHQPEYIKTLLKKGLIAPSLQIEGKALAEYAQEKSVAAEIVQFIAEQPEELDNVAAKKTKALNKPLSLKDSKSAPENVAKKLAGEMVAGATMKPGNAKFLVTEEDDKTKKFMIKPDSVATVFGTEMLRILSNKQFASKDTEAVVTDGSARPKSAVKWDDNIAGNYFLENNIPKGVDDEFIVNYARLCGVIQVSGEYDWNPRNFLRSEKTNRPVKIDNALFFNGYFIDKNHRIYGSMQSRSFMLFLSGMTEDEIKKNKVTVYDNINKQLDIDNGSIKQNKVIEEAYIREYNKGLDDKLLEKIKANIASPTNPKAARDKAAFIELMSGIQDTILLAQDEKFLQEYSKKYKDELGNAEFKTIEQCRKYFAQNAAQAQKQFGQYLDYFAEIAPERYNASVKNTVAPYYTEEEKADNTRKVMEKLLSSGKSVAKAPEPVAKPAEVVDELRKYSNALANEGKKVADDLAAVTEEVSAKKESAPTVIAPQPVVESQKYPSQQDIFDSEPFERYEQVIGKITFDNIDTNSLVEENGKKSSLLQSALNSINLSDAKNDKANFSNLLIAFALIEEGAKFDKDTEFSLTQEQKSKLVRSAVKYLQNSKDEFISLEKVFKKLVDEKVIDRDFKVIKNDGKEVAIHDYLNGIAATKNRPAVMKLFAAEKKQELPVIAKVPLIVVRKPAVLGQRPVQKRPEVVKAANPAIEKKPVAAKPSNAVTKPRVTKLEVAVPKVIATKASPATSAGSKDSGISTASEPEKLALDAAFKLAAEKIGIVESLLREEFAAGYKKLQSKEKLEPYEQDALNIVAIAFGDKKSSLAGLKNKTGFYSEERCKKVKGDPLLQMNVEKNLGKLKNAAQDYVFGADVSKAGSVESSLLSSPSSSPKPEKIKTLNESKRSSEVWL